MHNRYELVHDWEMTNVAAATPTPVWTLGDYLRKAREFAGISVSGMAQRLKVDRNTITNWEKDHVRVSYQTVISYASVTGVSVDWITGNSPDDGSTQGFRASTWFDGDLAEPWNRDTVFGQASLKLIAA